MRNQYLSNLKGRTCLLFFFLLFVAVAHAQWTPVGTPGFSPGGLSNWQHLEVDQNDTLYVSFNDEGQAGQGTVMKFDGTNWISIGTPGFTPGIAHHSSFGLGPSGEIYFSFADGNNLSKAAVMNYDGSNWISLGTGISTGECQYSNIKVGADGTPYLVYIDNGINGGSLIAKKYDGTAWIDMGTMPVASGGCSYATADLDDNDTLYIAYREGSGAVRVKKFDGTDWVDVGNSFPSQPVFAGDVYLKLNHNNVPYVTYWNPIPMGPRVSVQRFDGSSWVNVGPASFNNDIAQFTTIDFDPNDTAYVAYTELVMGIPKAVVQKFDGANWVAVGTPGFTNNVTAHLSLAIDGNGNPYVAFYDEDNGGKTTVMKYGLCTVPSVTSVVSSNSLICQGDTATLTLAGTLNDASNWYWFTGSCGGTLADSGATIDVIPGDTITYYVRGLGGCVMSGACTSVTVNVADSVVTPGITPSGDVLTSSSLNGNQWNLGNSPISGATSATYTVTHSGWYSVTVTNGNCSSTSDSVFVIASGIDDISSSQQPLVYPIRFTDIVHVDFPVAVKGINGWQLSISDNIGHIVYKQLGLEQKNIIHMEGLASGLYFLTISTGISRQVYKIIK